MFAITVIIKITWTMIIQTIAAAGIQLMFSCVGTVCRYSVQIQCVDTMCRYSVQIQCVDTVCRYNAELPLQIRCCTRHQIQVVCSQCKESQGRKQLVQVKTHQCEHVLVVKTKFIQTMFQFYFSHRSVGSVLGPCLGSPITQSPAPAPEPRVLGAIVCTKPLNQSSPISN